MSGQRGALVHMVQPRVTRKYARCAVHDYFSSWLDSEDPFFGIVLIARARPRTRCVRMHCIVFDACRWIVADHSRCHAAVRLHACDSAACLQFGGMSAVRLHARGSLRCQATCLLHACKLRAAVQWHRCAVMRLNRCVVMRV